MIDFCWSTESLRSFITIQFPNQFFHIVQNYIENTRSWNPIGFSNISHIVERLKSMRKLYKVYPQAWTPLAIDPSALSKNWGIQPCLVWLRWLERCPITKRLCVPFPVRAHAWVVWVRPGQIHKMHGPGACDPQHRCVQEATNQCFSIALMFLSL